MADGEQIDAKPPAGGIKTFSCPSCGGTVAIRAVGISISAVCQSCGSIIDVANDNFKIIEEAVVKRGRSHIPIGARAVLLEVEWEVIGYCVRFDETGQYDWREYLLFNPYQGFRFLVEADGHWNFVKMLRQDVDASVVTDDVWFEGRHYRVYVRGGAVVEYVMGEFYWRVKVRDKTSVADYISPPYILSMEKSFGDIVWSQGVYMEAEEIQQAFNLPDMPRQKGIAPNQPFKGAPKYLMGIAVLFITALLFAQFAYVKSAANQTIYQRNMVMPASYKGQLLISDPLEIPGDIGNVEVWASSPVSNNWMELDVSLVNDATQESDDFLLPIEYYSGYDSDGSWTEGSQSNNVVISSVPGGKYHLQVEPDAGAFAQGQGASVEIRVMRDVPVWGNFFVTLLLLAAYPFYVMMRSRSFETRRWANSDYAPATYSSGDDD